MADTEPDFKFLYKVILIGDSGVGKSSFLLNLTKGEFREDTVSTMGVEHEFKTMDLKGGKAKIQICDTAGQDRFRSIASVYYRKAAAVLVLFDCTSRDSFVHIDRWLEEVHKYCDAGVITLLIANKTDLVEKRDVTTKEAASFAAQRNLNYIETSAKTSDNVEEAFKLCVEEVHKARFSMDAGATGTKAGPSTGEGIQVRPETTEEVQEKKSGGCPC